MIVIIIKLSGVMTQWEALKYHSSRVMGLILSSGVCGVLCALFVFFWVSFGFSGFFSPSFGLKTGR